jgi:6,7-dimethyl-8-ribityllumazine synthase
MKTYEGNLIATGLRFGVVVSRFNELISRRLLASCEDALLRHGADEENVEVTWVPGSFEIPLAAQAMAQSGKYNAVICLGALIRGDTPHFEYIASQVSRGISMIGLDTGLPVIYGIVTAESTDQAIERAGVKRGNRGWDAAVSAIEMANLMKTLKA